MLRREALTTCGEGANHFFRLALCHMVVQIAPRLGGLCSLRVPLGVHSSTAPRFFICLVPAVRALGQMRSVRDLFCPLELPLRRFSAAHPAANISKRSPYHPLPLHCTFGWSPRPTPFAPLPPACAQEGEGRGAAT